MTEEIIWEGKPSQAMYALHHGIAALIAAFSMIIGFPIIAAVPLIYMMYLYLDADNTEYRITTERIITRRGILTKRTDEIETFRIGDVSVEEPLILRFFSLGNANAYTTDASVTLAVIEAVPNFNEIKEWLRMSALDRRKERGIIEFDGRGA
jgi:uncharacterized membrane protein YdbT with pleckstrin-like domain